jgi:hypothetical protein
MTVDIQELKDRYAATQDEDFRAVTRSDLTDGARQCYDEELAPRDPSRFQEVQQKDAEEAERRSRGAAADVQDPEPKQGRSHRVEKHSRPLAPEERRRLRQLQSKPILDKLSDYLLEIQAEVLPKSPEGRAVRYTLKNWTALTRYCADGDLEIDNNATERAIRGVAVGRHNWVFFGSDQGGKTAAVLRSFVASCQRAGVDPFTLNHNRRADQKQSCEAWQGVCFVQSGG